MNNPPCLISKLPAGLLDPLASLLAPCLGTRRARQLESDMLAAQVLQRAWAWESAQGTSDPPAPLLMSCVTSGELHVLADLLPRP